MSGTAALVLAAGHSRRFGAPDKLLAPLDGRPLAAHAAAALAELDLTHRLAVARDPVVAALFAGFEPVLLGPKDQLQSDSLRAGVRAALAHAPERLLVVLADMPRLTGDDLRALLALAEATGRTVAATDGTRVQPPVCFAAADLPALLALQGDRGAGALLAALPEAQRLAVPPGHLADVDTPEALEALQARS